MGNRGSGDTRATIEPEAGDGNRQTFAYFSLRAGVPISDLAREMGHTDVSRAYRSYGQWCSEQGDRAASIRSAWARTQAGGTDVVPDTPEACL